MAGRRTFPMLGAALFFGALALQPSDIAPAATLAAAAERQAQSFSTLTSQELALMLQRKDFFFVNVHVPYEGEIEGTDAFIPYDLISKKMDTLPKDKNAKIVLYCRSGRMSELAARELSRLGYTQVSHLAGGMIDWEKSGHQVVRK